MSRTIVSLYSNKKGEIANFLENFDELDKTSQDTLEWSRSYENPIEIADIIGAFIDNNDKYEINMWISLDEDFFINVRDNNVDDIIKYLYERFPY
ncbi:MAG: hypothetical protein ACLUD1_10045 [Clostridia bacterium]